LQKNKTAFCIHKIVNVGNLSDESVAVKKSIFWYLISYWLNLVLSRLTRRCFWF